MMCVYRAEPCYYYDQHDISVKAVTALAHNSSTETIDVGKLSQATPQLIQYQVDIADAGGRLFCVDRRVGADCWLKIISIANDIQSSNVVLMATSKGVVLKTIRSISPGEPLLMWFAENILALLNMPYLTRLNIQEGQYKCHVCDLTFEYPNPLKIHLALQCNRLHSNYLWAQLAREFPAAPYSLLANLFQTTLPPFSFRLSRSPERRSPERPLSPITNEPNEPKPCIEKQSSLEDLHSDSGYGLSSPNSSGLSASSAGSDIEKSPTSLRSLTFSSPPAISQAGSFPQTSSPIEKAHAPRHSAFKPYSTKCRLFSPDSDKSSSPGPAAYRVHSPASTSNAVIVRPDAQAAHMETLVSNLGKSTEGHRCLYCGKIYSRKYGLKIHIRTHTGYKPLKCRVCQRPFGDPSNLNKHIRLHSDGELPYK